MEALLRQGRCMVDNRLFVTLDGPNVNESGVSAEDFVTVLRGMQRAMRLMVEHLGQRSPGPGQPPRWVQEQSRLQLLSTHQGSLVAELTLEQRPNEQLHLEDHGKRALDALCNWDGAESSNLPSYVTDELFGTADSLSNDISLWLGNAEQPRRVKVRRMQRGRQSILDTEQALLRGWLREVNWQRGTAQLYDYTGGYVQLRFDSPLGDEMLRLATRYVEVTGSGSFNVNDKWTTVQVERIVATSSWQDPFDLEAFHNYPEPNPFDPDVTVSINLTDEEWEAFNSSISEGRDA
jgi:hypothetical protein